MSRCPSTSNSDCPSASWTKNGSPPTDLNARTGELTPPCSSDCARANRAWERSVFMFLLLHRRPPRVREPNFPWLLLQERLQPRSFRPEASRVVAAGTVSSRSEEHTSELQSLMRISYAVFCLKKKT